MILETERLELRPTGENDLQLLFTILTNPFVRKYLLDDEILNDDQVTEILNISIQNFRTRSYGLWLIEEKESNQVAGLAGLWEFSEEGQPQLLYALLPQETGLGFATESVMAIVKYAFDELGFEKVLAACDEPNVASQRLAERIGMTKKELVILNGKSLVQYEMVSGDFRMTNDHSAGST